jgi:hypothetical protein
VQEKGGKKLSSHKKNKQNTKSNSKKCNKKRYRILRLINSNNSLKKMRTSKNHETFRVTFNIPITGRKIGFFDLIAWRTRKGTADKRLGFLQRSLMRREQIVLSAESNIVSPLGGEF